MIDIINSQQCYTSPTMNWTIQYEHKREGADMYYRFYWKVWLPNSSNYYDYGIALKLFLNGTAYSVTVKGVTSNEKQWSKEGTTEWYKVANKTSGSTSFYAQLYDTSRSKVMATSSTYSLSVASAGSVLGKIKNFNIGDEITIPITKYDYAYIDTLYIKIGNLPVKTVSGIDPGDKVSFTEEEQQQIYNVLTMFTAYQFSFTLKSWNGVTEETSQQFAYGFITDADPIFPEDHITYWDANESVVEITEFDKAIVQNKSDLMVMLAPAKPQKGAEIMDYEVTVNGVTITTERPGELFFGKVNTSQNTKIIATAIDSRGNKTTVEVPVAIVPYATPTFTVALERLNNYEDETYLTVDATISSVTDKNDAIITYRTKKGSESYGKAVTIGNKVKYTLNCDKNYAHTFNIEVKDRFESVEKVVILPKGRFPLFIDTDKNAVGVNEFPGNGEALRVAGGVGCFDDGIVLKSPTKAFKITIDDSGALVIQNIT